MNRYTIWREQGGNFLIMGTYAGDTEAAALDVLCQEAPAPGADPPRNCAGFTEHCALYGLVRDNYRVKLVAPEA